MNASHTNQIHRPRHFDSAPIDPNLKKQTIEFFTAPVSRCRWVRMFAG